MDFKEKWFGYPMFLILAGKTVFVIDKLFVKKKINKIKKEKN